MGLIFKTIVAACVGWGALYAAQHYWLGAMMDQVAYNNDSGLNLTAPALPTMEIDPEKIKELLTFVLVGAGPTGVEMAGAIAELAHKALATDFRHIDTKSTRIILIEASLRTNHFVADTKEKGQSLAIKLDSQAIDGLPAPRPWREIFVYGSEVEGVHLRFGPVARGGLWSRPRRA